MTKLEDEARMESIQTAIEEDALQADDATLLDDGSPARVRALFARSLRAHGYRLSAVSAAPSRRRGREQRATAVRRLAEDRHEPLRAAFGPPADSSDDDDLPPPARPRSR